MMRETRDGTFSNRDFGQEEAGEARARRLRMEEAAAAARRGWGAQKVQDVPPAPPPQTRVARSFEPEPAPMPVAPGSAQRIPPVHQPPSPDLDALPDVVLDSLPWPGQSQNRPPAWMLEEDLPQTTEPKQPPAASAYEQEWNTLRPQVQNPWHSMDEEERKMIIHPVELEKEPAIVAEVMQREMEKPAKSGFQVATEPMSGDRSNVRSQADIGVTGAPQPKAEFGTDHLPPNYHPEQESGPSGRTIPPKNQERPGREDLSPPMIEREAAINKAPQPPQDVLPTNEEIAGPVKRSNPPNSNDKEGKLDSLYNVTQFQVLNGHSWDGNFPDYKSGAVVNGQFYSGKEFVEGVRSGKFILTDEQTKEWNAGTTGITHVNDKRDVKLIPNPILHNFPDSLSLSGGPKMDMAWEFGHKDQTEVIDNRRKVEAAVTQNFHSLGKSLGAGSDLGAVIGGETLSSGLQTLLPLGVNSWAKGLFNPAAPSLIAGRSVTVSYLDDGGRILGISAEVTPASIGKGTEATSAATQWVRSIGNYNDDAGHLRGKHLGGLGGKTGDNVMPQNFSVNRGSFARFEKKIAHHVRNSGQTVTIHVLPQYHFGATRPHSILYLAKFDGQWQFRTFANPF